MDNQQLEAIRMLSNHDIFAGARIWDQLAGDEARYRLAAATYLLMPGIPFLYYGEEIGMAGAATLGGDARLRTPMSWSDCPHTAGFTQEAVGVAGNLFTLALSAYVAGRLHAITRSGALMICTVVAWSAFASFASHRLPVV